MSGFGRWGIQVRKSTWCGVATIALCAMLSAGCEDDVTGRVDEIDSVALQLEADTLSVGEETSLQATVLGVDGSILNSKEVTFSSGNESVVSVEPTGVVGEVLLHAVGSGTATITADVDGHRATAFVYVRRATTIALAPADTTLVVDERVTLVATVLDSDGAQIADAIVRWSDEEADVVHVDPGLAHEEEASTIFVAASPGNEVITAETEGLTASIDVTVVPSEVGSIVLAPDSLTIAVGDTAQLTVTVRDTLNAVIDPLWIAMFCGPGEFASRATPMAPASRGTVSSSAPSRKRDA